MEYCCSIRMASAASWNLRAKVWSSLPMTAFFTSCCVMVEPPCVILPAMRLATIARKTDGTLMAPWV